MKKRNKAQATIFMIIGLIIIVAGTAYFYFQEKIIEEGIAPEVEIALRKLPVEFDPVRSFVTNCLDDVSTEGLRLIGKQGGYISLDAEYSQQTFKLNQDPTDSDAVEFAPGSGLRVPYWHYLSSDNDCLDCKFESKRPELREGQNSIQNQLNRYVENNIGQCLDDFKPLTDQGYKVEAGELSVETTVTKNDVVVVMDYDLEVEKESSRSTISRFAVTLPVNLQEIYNLATEITNLEMENRFLEKAAANLIASFAGVDKTKLPPMSDMRFEFGSSTNWMKSDIQNKVTQVLTSYIPLFQVDNTRNFNRNIFATSLQQRLYDYFIIPQFDENFLDLETSFTYLDFWPVYFDLNCNGEFCEAESVSPALSFLGIGIQRYNFLYDISFPAYIEIKEPDAFNGQGYTFSFFLESNLRNNEPIEVQSTPLQAAALSFGSLLCDLSNRNAGPATINVKDRLTDAPLEEVQITYTVADETCFIGETDNEGTLTAKFPSGAIGGVIQFLKNDYLKESLPFDAGADETIDKGLEPIKAKNVIIKKKKVVKKQIGTSGEFEWVFQDETFDLNPKEDAIITLTRISPLEEDDLVAGTFYSLNQEEPSEIRVASGEYEAEINLMLKDSLSIPEREEEAGELFGFIGGTKFTIPAMEFNEDNPLPSGGLDLKVKLTSEDLQNYNTIVFYVLSFALEDVPEQSRVLEDLQETNKIEQYSVANQAKLKPTFQ